MKLLLVISEEWYFLSHRLPLALEAKRRGWDVVVATRLGAKAQALAMHGIRSVHLDLERGRVAVWRDLAYFVRLMKLYRQEKPDIVHHVAMKPCLYGSLAAWCAGVPCVVNALAGLGYLFSSARSVVKAMRSVTLLLFKRLFSRRNSMLILQNPEDVRFFSETLGLQRGNIRLIKGAGVDLTTFRPAKESPAHRDPPLIVMASRLLRDKGVEELVAASTLARSRGAVFRVAIVGDADRDNPNAVGEAFLQTVREQGTAELWGRRDDIASVYQQADIAILPSFYPEGMPKTLMEAAACGLPIITTDTQGCRETVDTAGSESNAARHGNGQDCGAPLMPALKIGANGIVVPAKEVEPLADAIAMLASNPGMRKEMGQKSRAKAEREFGVEHVVEKTFAVYEELLVRAGRKHQEVPGDRLQPPPHASIRPGHKHQRAA